jgi:hypothetical protein
MKRQPIILWIAFVAIAALVAENTVATVNRHCNEGSNQETTGTVGKAGIVARPALLCFVPRNPSQLLAVTDGTCCRHPVTEVAENTAATVAVETRCIASLRGAKKNNELSAKIQCQFN